MATKHIRRSGFWGSGDAFVWMSAGATAIALVLILGVLYLVAAGGLGFFWPSPLTRYQLANGTIVMGQKWDEELMGVLDIPASMMPVVKDCASEFGEIDADMLGKPIPVRAIAGDQQAALFGQTCFDPGSVKSTYGTGCFLVMNTGNKAVSSGNKLLTTVGYRLDGKVCYALEGSIFMAGATMQWLRDGLGIIGSAAESTARAI